MFWLGSGPIRGFAVTLTLGIMTTVYTAFTIARLLVVWWLAAQKKRRKVEAPLAFKPGHLEHRTSPPMKFLFKGVDFFPHDTRWKIIERRYIFIGVSWALAMLAAVAADDARPQLRRRLQGRVADRGAVEGRRRSTSAICASKLDRLGIGDVQVQAVGTGSEALIRVAQQVPTKELNEEKVQAAANDKVKGALGESIEVRRIEVVGPTVSAELKRTGFIAVVASMLGIVLYVWFRFEWQFARRRHPGAVARRASSRSACSRCCWYEFDLSVVAAILTWPAIPSTTPWWCSTASARTCAVTSACR